jgi:hypothetical protein
VALAVVLLSGCAIRADCAPNPSAAGGSAVRPQARGRFQATITPVAAQQAAAMVARGVQKEGCPTEIGDLSLVTFTYWNKQGRRSVGRLVVHRSIAEDIASIMGELYAAHFKLARVEPIEKYGGDDDLSMRSNNTSAYNCRAKAASFYPDGRPAPTEFSNHSYGVAIDINPLENPFFRLRPDRIQAWTTISQGLRDEDLAAALLKFCRADAENCDVEPEQGRRFLDRAASSGLLTPDSVVVAAFRRRGFVWGGDWPSTSSDRVLSDLQHFEKPMTESPEARRGD